MALLAAALSSTVCWCDRFVQVSTWIAAARNAVRGRQAGRMRGERHLGAGGAQRGGAAVVGADERAHGHAALEQHLGQRAAGAAHRPSGRTGDQHQAAALLHTEACTLLCWGLERRQ